MIKDNVLVGHVPRNISVACSAFLRRGGIITCTITGARQYSSDLPQGGLEIPCRLTFSASSKEISKIKKLLPLAPPDCGGTATIAANSKASTASKPRPDSSSMATGPLLNFKPNPDEDYCDLTMSHLQLKNAEQATLP